MNKTDREKVKLIISDIKKVLIKCRDFIEADLKHGGDCPTKEAKELINEINELVGGINK